jgi:hypothetical protein
MSPTARVRSEGVGDLYVAAKISPVTNEEVEYWPFDERINPNPVIAVEAIGLTPKFPVILVAPVVVIPDSVRIT